MPLELQFLKRYMHFISKGLQLATELQRNNPGKKNTGFDRIRTHVSQKLVGRAT